MTRTPWPRNLGPAYTAINEADARERLAEFHDTWGDTFPAIKDLWVNAWAEFVPFVDFSPEIRRVIYSTNAIESLRARFRRATQASGHSLPMAQGPGIRSRLCREANSVCLPSLHDPTGALCTEAMNLRFR